MSKKMWRCSVFGDIHYGDKLPEVCPTCGEVNAFVLTDFDEAVKVIDTRTEPFKSEEIVIASWKEFTERNRTIRLTENEEDVKMLCSGVLENLRNMGLRYCPCRIPSGNKARDMALICPCNFTRQKNWAELGECWCGLFKKMEVKL
jgi:ferredoxin-thioredoxin reductase catalytic subunit